MKWGRRAKPERVDGWRIIEEHNEFTEETRWIVFLPGYLGSYISRPPQRHIFDTYEEAFAFYANRVGWHRQSVTQPSPEGAS